MTALKPSIVVRFFPSLADVAFLMPLVLLFGPMQGTKVLLGDSDTGWHLRSGDWILANGRVPDHDFFSFTKPGQPWFAWEWLWDAIFAWLHQHWGLAAVVLLSTIVLCATSALIFRLVRRACNNVFVAFAVTSVAVAVTSLHWLARPHLLTLLFATIFYSILEAARTSVPRRRLLLLLPALTVLWTNLHAGFLAGILFILAYAAGECVAALVEAQPDTRKAALTRARVYFLSATACFVASLANPYGYRLHVHIYRYLTDSFLFEHITEFLAINFRHPDAVFYEIMFLLAAIAAYRAAVRKEFAHVFLIVGWGHLALYSQRNLPLFAIASAPLVAGMLDEWINAARGVQLAGWVRRFAATLADTAAEFGAMDGIRRVHLPSILGVIALAVMLSAPQPPEKFRARWHEKRFPVAVLEHFKCTGTPPSLFTIDQWGGYLIYSLYPNVRVFVDGRSDFYGADFDNAYLDVLRIKHTWQRILDRYSIDAILLPVDAPLVGALKESNRWRTVFDDGSAIMFRSAAARHAADVVSIANSGTQRDCEVAQPKLTTKLEDSSIGGERP